MVNGTFSATSNGATRKFELTAGTMATLGRSSRCTVQVDDPKVSRQHCLLDLVDGKLQVTDLQSSQGLLYRGRRCTACEIEIGDGFHVGETFIRFEALGPGSEPARGPDGNGDQRGAVNAQVAAQDEPAIGTGLGSCTLKALLGRGDRATVFLGEQAGTGDAVAVKVLRGGDDEARATFLADARTAASIPDRRLLRVRDVGQAGERAFAVLDLVRGQSLAAAIDAGRRLPWQELAPVLDDVLQALAVLHERGVVHGGVRPGNVFALDGGGGVLADARATPRPRRGEGPWYAAPEQLAGQATDRRADLFAFGCVAYAALAGEPPFFFADGQGDIQEARRYAPASLLAADPTIPRALDDLICLRLLVTDPAGRPESAAQARAELQAAVSGPGRVAVAAPPPPRAPVPVPVPVVTAPPIGPPAAAPMPAFAPRSEGGIEQVARGEARRKPASASTVFAAKLTAQAIIFGMHVIAVVALLVVGKVIFPGFDIYAWFGVGR